MIGQDNVRDTTKIDILNPDSGQFTLIFKNPKDGSTWTSGRISANFGSWDFNRAISGYYGSVWGSGIQVVRTMYDVNDQVTTSSSLAKKFSYNVTMTRSISGPSVTSIGISMISTASTISITLPQNL